MAIDVNIIVPTLALDAYCEQAVASCLEIRNSLSSTVEIVVDGPAPTSIPTWARQSRVNVHCTDTRRGAGAAINLGVARSRAPYIARLDSDDLALVDAFADQAAVLESSPGVKLVGTTASLVDSQGDLIGQFRNGGSGDVTSVLLHHNPLVHSTFFLRRPDFQSLGGYDPTLVRMQDYDLALRAALLGDIRIVPIDSVGYRVHPGQSSTQMHGFFHVMATITRGRRKLAARVGASASKQLVIDIAYASAQLLRYSGIRRPRYLG